MQSEHIEAWFIARTKPQRETYATRNLELRHLEVFLPRIIELDYDNRTATQRRPEPLFPGYLFVRMKFPLDYYRVIWSPGIRDLVSLGHGPVPICERVVQEVRYRCDGSGVVRVSPEPWTPGDRVEIQSGPLKGLLATVLTVMPRRRRIKLLIDFLSQQSPVEMPLAALKPSHRPGSRPAGGYSHR
jgi:transcriptional antiterminator RfaH